jgi:hypothetical protein
MDITQLLEQSGSVTFDDIERVMALSEARDKANEAIKERRQTEKESFHAQLMETNQPEAFKCDWCGNAQYKARMATNIFPEGGAAADTAQRGSQEHETLATDCFTTDSGETWFCQDCDNYASLCGRMDFVDYPHTYRYLDGDTAGVVTIQPKPPKKPEEVMKPYKHKYDQEDYDEFLPLESAIISHRTGGSELQYMVRMGPAKPKQPYPDCWEMSEETLRYEALEWVDEMLDAYQTEHSLVEDDDFWESDDDCAELEKVAAEANAATGSSATAKTLNKVQEAGSKQRDSPLPRWMCADEEKSTAECDGASPDLVKDIESVKEVLRASFTIGESDETEDGGAKRVSFSDQDVVHEVPNRQQEDRYGHWAADGARERMKELVKICARLEELGKNSSARKIQTLVRSYLAHVQAIGEAKETEVYTPAQLREKAIWDSEHLSEDQKWEWYLTTRLDPMKLLGPFDAQRAVYCTQPVEVQDGGKVTIYEGGLTIEVLDEGAVRADVYQEEPTLLVASVQDDESSSVFGGGATPGIKRFADCVARLEAHAKLEEQLTGNEKADKKARRKTQWKPCRCGSHSHRRTNHSDCPLNKKKSLA